MFFKLIRSHKMIKDTSSILQNVKYRQFMANNDYEAAVNCINSLQSNSSYIQNAASKGILPHSATYSTTIAETEKYLLRTGVTLDQLDKLSIIHVAGTKGKGSTCAFSENILRQYGYQTGFYLSPHLVAIRERIRVNGKLLSKDEFAQNVAKVYSQLMDKRDHPNDMPSYFRFLTVLAFNIFLNEKIDVAVIEVGIGGEYDCTNVIRNTPIVGITSLGIDHVSLLGSTIEQIAWQKAGIMKKHSIAFTVDQQENAMNVLKERSIERECSLQTVPDFDSYIWNNEKPILGINGKVHEKNASLAIQLTHAWMRRCGTRNLSDLFENKLIVPEKTKLGLSTCKWPGRNQILKTPTATYYLDGAHTSDSLELCAGWFKTITNDLKSRYKVLMFNVTGNRNSEGLLKKLMEIDFNHVMFVPNVASTITISDQTNFIITEDQQIKRCDEHKKIWLKLSETNSIFSSNKNVFVFPSVEKALNSLPKNQNLDILITGSLHLVGAALSLLDPDLKTF